MHPGFLLSQMFSCQQPVASAQDTAWHGRLPLQNSLCSFVRLYRRPCKVHCCAARKGKAMTQQKMRHQTHTRQLSSGRLKRLCQEESRLEGLKPSSTMAEPGSSDQEGISEDDEAASPSSQPTRYVTSLCKHSRLY